MSKLVDQINFKHIYFQGNMFDSKYLLAAIDGFAEHLKDNLKSDSPFVLLSSFNHIKTIVAYYGILKSGKIAVIVDPGCKDLDLTEIIADVEPAAMVIPNTNEVWFNYKEEIFFRTQPKDFTISSDLKDVCTIAYTNAEDGFLKGAMITEDNLLSEVKALQISNKLNVDSVTYSLLPFYHLYGLAQGILISTMSGASAIVTDVNTMKLQVTLKDIENYKVSHFYSVPAMYFLMSKMPEIKKIMAHVESCYSGGVQLSEYIFNTFKRNSGISIREGYGLTESSPGVALNYEHDEPVVNSFGTALPGCNIKILDHNDKECKIGTLGEICIQGKTVFKGYWNAPEASSDALKNGWLHTGDYGVMDNRGYVYFKGVKKNMINVAGNNVYPKKLQRHMSMHPNVNSINISSDTSILQGETVGAEIYLRDNSNQKQIEFKQWCFDHINNTLLPKTWQFA